jgi:hypothetical protein
VTSEPGCASTIVQLAREADLRVAMVRSPSAYTDRAPAVEVTVPPDLHDRNLGVVLYLIAAVVEARSDGNQWAVAIEDFGRHRGRVLLRLGTESHDEASRALKLLQGIVAALRAS